MLRLVSQLIINCRKITNLILLSVLTRSTTHITGLHAFFKTKRLTALKRGATVAGVYVCVCVYLFVCINVCVFMCVCVRKRPERGNEIQSAGMCFAGEGGMRPIDD